MLACLERHRMGIPHKNKMKAITDFLLSFIVISPITVNCSNKSPFKMSFGKSRNPF